MCEYNNDDYVILSIDRGRGRSHNFGMAYLVRWCVEGRGGGCLHVRWGGVLPVAGLLVVSWGQPAQGQETAGASGAVPSVSAAQSAPPSVSPVQSVPPSVSPVQSAPPAAATRPVDVQLVYQATPDFRRAQLEEERASLSLGGPIAVTSIGGVVLLAGGLSFMIGTLIHADCVFDTTCQHKPWLHAGVPLMLGGAVMTGLGGAWIGVRVAHRQRLDREIERLGPVASGPALSLGLVPRAFGSSVQFRLNF